MTDPRRDYAVMLCSVSSLSFTPELCLLLAHVCANSKYMLSSSLFVFLQTLLNYFLFFMDVVNQTELFVVHVLRRAWEHGGLSFVFSISEKIFSGHQGKGNQFHVSFILCPVFQTMEEKETGKCFQIGVFIISRRLTIVVWCFIYFETFFSQA